LGSGAFGDIYKVQKIKTGEFYAAKIEKATKS
jgi:casein kinase 1